jgi:hypothetical protein
MKYLIKTSCLSILVLFVAFSFSEAAWLGWQGDPEAYKVPCQRLFNVNEIVTIEGVVEAIEHATPVWGPMKGPSYGLHLRVRTDKGLRAVHIGPGWYMDKYKISFKLKEKVQVTGSQIVFEGEDLIIAQEVVRDSGNVLTIRDETGCPMWARPETETD